MDFSRALRLGQELHLHTGLAISLTVIVAAVIVPMLVGRSPMHFVGAFLVGRLATLPMIGMAISGFGLVWQLRGSFVYNLSKEDSAVDMRLLFVTATVFTICLVLFLILNSFRRRLINVGWHGNVKRASTNVEVAEPDNLAKFDDAYFEEYARKLKEQMATTLQTTTPSVSQSALAQPNLNTSTNGGSFGRRK